MKKERLQELAGVQINEADVISSSTGSAIEKLVAKLASELLKEGVSLAKEVYGKEGAGRSGAKNEAEYVRYATKRFLDKEYKSAIMDNIVEEYNDLLH